MRVRWPVGVLGLIFVGLMALAFSGSAPSLRVPGVAVVAPLEGAAHSVLDGLFGLVPLIRTLSVKAEENEQLRRQVDQLQAEVVRLREAGEENRELRALLQYERDNPGRDYQAAQVLAIDPSNLVRSVTVGLGAEDGVRRGMVGVTDLGLAGKVVEVYPRASKLLLVTDPSSVVNGVVQRSRVEGVVTGRADGRLKMDFVEKSADVQPGDLVVSSGLGGGFPRGLLVGRVESASSNDQDLFKTVVLEPAGRFTGIRSLLIIKDFTPIELKR